MHGWRGDVLGHFLWLSVWVDGASAGNLPGNDRLRRLARLMLRQGQVADL